MGRRAKKAPVQTKKRATLAKQFKCPFCANDHVVECKMDLKVGLGKLDCRMCGASYQMPIHHLHEPIDVFSEWLDDCEAAAAGGGARARGTGGGSDSVPHPYEDEDDENEDEDEDNIPEASGLKSKKVGNNKVVGPSSKVAANYSALGLDDSDDDDDEED